jgi:GPI ethanolamine phosphate transferase 2/3 subunit F
MPNYRKPRPTRSGIVFTPIKIKKRPKTPIERALVYPVVGTAMGCWTGAIPIALDWDRPWQAWPLTPALGALVGYVLGALGAVAMSSVEVVVRRMGERGLGEREPEVVKAKRKVKKGKVRKIKKLE